MKIQSISSVLLFIIYCFLFLYSCGYTLHNKVSLPFDSIRIGSIENMTAEPKLQDHLHQALAEEFLKRGVNVYSGSGYELSGVIDKFELKILSEKSELAAEYEVIMKGDFQLIGPSGDVRELKNMGSPFIVSFDSTGILNELIAAKEFALHRAVKDMAEEISAAIIYSSENQNIPQPEGIHKKSL